MNVVRPLADPCGNINFLMGACVHRRSCRRAKHVAPDCVPPPPGTPSFFYVVKRRERCWRFWRLFVFLFTRCDFGWTRWTRSHLDGRTELCGRDVLGLYEVVIVQVCVTISYQGLSVALAMTVGKSFSGAPMDGPRCVWH